MKEDLQSFINNPILNDFTQESEDGRNLSKMNKLLEYIKEGDSRFNRPSFTLQSLLSLLNFLPSNQKPESLKPVLLAKNSAIRLIEKKGYEVDDVIEILKSLPEQPEISERDFFSSHGIELFNHTVLDLQPWNGEKTMAQFTQFVIRNRLYTPTSYNFDRIMRDYNTPESKKLTCRVFYSNGSIDNLIKIAKLKGYRPADEAELLQYLISDDLNSLWRSTVTILKDPESSFRQTNAMTVKLDIVSSVRYADKQIEFFFSNIEDIKGIKFLFVKEIADSK